MGWTKPGPGRPKGSQNKDNRAAREAIAAFVELNSERMQGWLDAIAQDPKHGPAGAFDRLMSVMEYYVPKLARTEHTGADGGPLRIVATPDDQAI